jgi:hypothetical protein
MKITLLAVISLFCLLSCVDKKVQTKESYNLVASDKQLLFALDPNTKTFILALFPFTDETGKEYLTFQNQDQNEILFYDMNSRKLEFKVKPAYEGPNGVGQVLGYYVHTTDSIFLTISGTNEIVLVNRNAEIKDKINYERAEDGTLLTDFCSISSVYQPIIMIDKEMYIMSGCNRWLEKDPVAAVINLEDKTIHSLPYYYPSFPGADNKAKRAGIEEHLSRCFDGKHFVYSFYFDETIYIASQDHDSIKEVKVKSKYIDKVRLLDDYGNLTITDACENPNYGNLLFDKYRNVYYRIAYPETEIEKEVKGMELLQYGRKNFSIIILDKNFNIIGETLFPDYTYNSTVMFVREDGLYISDSHYLNPDYSDDQLSFKCFTLKKEN